MRYTDPGDGIDDNGGNPRTLAKNYIYVTWAWPSNMANPSSFEVAIYIGTDPTATNTYVVPLQKTLGSDRAVQVMVPIKTTLTGINASVRAIYG